MNWEFITDEFKKIPQGLKYFFFSGAILIFIPWLIDHWGSEPYKFFIWDVRQLFFSTGLLLILLCLLILIIRNIYSLGRVAILRKRYPLEKLNKSFHLVWFKGGHLYLFDKETKLIHHISPYETAQDLLLVHFGDHHDERFGQVDKSKTLIFPNYQIDLNEYFTSGPINTRT